MAKLKSEEKSELKIAAWFKWPKRSDALKNNYLNI